MTKTPAQIWTDEMSVIFTSFWGWSPETWGTIGWTGAQGLSHRTKLLKVLTDPFITVIYATNSTKDSNLRGKIVGFYLVSHEAGHRDEFTHPQHHPHQPEKWEYSLRALSAFTYLPEHRMAANQFDPTLVDRALAVSKWAEILTNREKIDKLRAIPWVESPVYLPAGRETESVEEFEPLRGLARAGPANAAGYVVSTSAQELKRELYLLRLGGGADAYLGRSAKGREIYKLGLSTSPQLRMQSLQKTMPYGAFVWSVHRQSGNPGEGGSFSFEAAVTGEYAMKTFLSQNAEWLGGEFYLATKSDVETAWKLGQEAAVNF